MDPATLARRTAVSREAAISAARYIAEQDETFAEDVGALQRSHRDPGIRALLQQEGLTRLILRIAIERYGYEADVPASFDPRVQNRVPVERPQEGSPGQVENDAVSALMEEFKQITTANATEVRGILGGDVAEGGEDDRARQLAKLDGIGKAGAESIVARYDELTAVDADDDEE